MAGFERLFQVAERSELLLLCWIEFAHCGRAWLRRRVLRVLDPSAQSEAVARSYCSKEKPSIRFVLQMTGEGVRVRRGPNRRRTERVGYGVTVHEPSDDLLQHCDRGSQYASDDYRKRLRAAHLTCSMSRKGDCWDSAVV